MVSARAERKNANSGMPQAEIQMRVGLYSHKNLALSPIPWTVANRTEMLLVGPSCSLVLEGGIFPKRPHLVWRDRDAVIQDNPRDGFVTRRGRQGAAVHPVLTAVSCNTNRNGNYVIPEGVPSKEPISFLCLFSCDLWASTHLAGVHWGCSGTARSYPLTCVE